MFMTVLVKTIVAQVEKKRFKCRLFLVLNLIIQALNVCKRAQAKHIFQMYSTMMDNSYLIVGREDMVKIEFSEVALCKAIKIQYIMSKE